MDFGIFYYYPEGMDYKNSLYANKELGTSGPFLILLNEDRHYVIFMTFKRKTTSMFNFFV